MKLAMFKNFSASLALFAFILTIFLGAFQTAAVAGPNDNEIKEVEKAIRELNVQINAIQKHIKQMKAQGADEYDCAMSEEKKHELIEKRAVLQERLENLNLFNY